MPRAIFRRRWRERPRPRRTIPTAAAGGGQSAILPGPAGVIRIWASPGSVATTDILPATNAATIRLRASAGTVLAVQAAPLPGRSGVIRLGPSAGTIHTVQIATPSAPAGRILMRPGAGQVVAGDGSVTVTARAGVILLRPGRGSVLAVAGGDLDGAIIVRPPRLDWRVDPPRVGRS
jgi:hypothetical protein